MSRLREGRANTARGAAHFLRETVGRVRYCRGQRTTHATGRQRVLHSWRGIRLPQDGCPLLHHHPPAQARLRNLIEAIPEDAWTPIPYWMDGAADVAETTCTPIPEPNLTPHRCGSSSGV